ncbi:surfactin synthase thioesterase subunit [Haloactinospora alba]|uniref:Surfactin synthase thioesterase subunit n=1 Tax=Haloactinospora alba TaxID=405555 RepID=A0A543N973_9ACTN|nr:thioesterase domain-containing protein [Haloactinospora alba]TQN28384.1 surfactin synthase thioesterase subunit [Haloactinospora alba]
MAPQKWFLREPSPDAEFRLLCFPYSGCGASMFRHWPAWLGPVELLAVQPPWRENRMAEPHFGTYERLAASFVADAGEYLDRPYGVFGHCGGALPAFETALWAAEHGPRPPDRCFVSSQVAPQDGPYGRFLGLAPAELRAELLDLLASMGAHEPSGDMVDLVMEVLQADLETNRRYRREQPARVPFPLTVLGWRDDAEIPPALTRGWAEWGDVGERLLEGTHHTFLRAPEALRNVLRSDLTGV